MNFKAKGMFRIEFETYLNEGESVSVRRGEEEILSHNGEEWLLCGIRTGVPYKDKFSHVRIEKNWNELPYSDRPITSVEGVHWCNLVDLEGETLEIRPEMDKNPLKNDRETYSPVRGSIVLPTDREDVFFEVKQEDELYPFYRAAYDNEIVHPVGHDEIDDEQVHAFTLREDVPEGTKVTWYTEGGVDSRYAKEHKVPNDDRHTTAFTFRVEEDYWTTNDSLTIYCDLDIPVAGNVTFKKVINGDKVALIAKDDVQLELEGHYLYRALYPFTDDKLYLSVKNSVGVPSNAKVNWVIDAGFKKVQLNDQPTTKTQEIDPKTLLDNDAPKQGSFDVGITATVVSAEGCVLSTVQASMPMVDVETVVPPPPVDYNTKWTPNYNGVNSYVEIPEWKPSGEFEIECDVYAITNTSKFSFIMGSVDKSNFFGFKTTGEGAYCSPNMTFVVTPAESGFTQAKLTGSAGCKLDYIGSRGGADFFKGQISNLKLVDKTNEENSRFYPGVIYSYVDPDAVDVPMPSSTVLVDEWSTDGSTNGTLVNFGTSVPYVPKLEEGEGYLINYTGVNGTRGISTEQKRIAINSVQLDGLTTLDAVNGSSIRTTNAINATDWYYEVISGTDSEIQQGFQYPNVFSITPPPL